MNLSIFDANKFLMRNIIAFFGLFFLYNSCNSQSQLDKPNVNPSEIQSEYMNWLNYYNDEIMLSADFVALDENTNRVSKEAFLTTLSDGKFIPLKMETSNDSIYYKLYKIEPTADTSISATVMESAFNELQNFKKEGTDFSPFSFQDLNGNVIDNQSLKGKTVVIKCWYIHCAACIKEFPDVNKLADEYKDRNDIVFLSLAEDNQEQLKTFLAKKPLHYSVVPNMKQYMNETLQLNAFPTHFIIDKEGKIVKVLSNFKSLDYSLKNYLTNH